MSRIKPFSRDDIAEVASLMWKFLYSRQGLPPAGLEAYLLELFFCSPCADPGFPSLVYENDLGAVSGFLGVLTRPMSYRGRPLRATFGSSFVVDPQSRATPAALELVRSYFSLGQDLSLSDTANPASQTIWGGFRGKVVSGFRMHWSRPVRPASYLVHTLSRFAKSAVLPCRLRGLRKRLCSLGDRLTASSLNSGPSGSDIQAKPLDLEMLLSFLRASSKGYAIRPVYDHNCLHWLLRFMERMQAYGELHKIAIRNSAGNVVGCYVYCAKQDGIGEVVFLAAAPKDRNTVLGHLFHHASTHGAIALHGKLEPGTAHLLSGRLRFVYDGRDPLLICSRDPDLTHLAANGGISLTRLDGEWCVKFGMEAMAPEGSAKPAVSSARFPYRLVAS